jgi:hypothetical protein
VQAGSAAALARQLGVAPTTVQRALKSGIISPHLAGLLVANEHDIQAARRERAKFRELLSLAEKRGKVPWVVTERGKREGPYTRGLYWHLNVRRELTAQTIGTITNWLARLNGTHHHWQALATIVQFDPSGGRRSPAGYKQTVVQLNPAVMGDYVVVSELITPRTSQAGAIAGIAHKLEAQLEEFYTFLVGVRAWNHDLKTDEERKHYQTTQRKKRRHDQRRRSNRRAAKSSRR